MTINNNHNKKPFLFVYPQSDDIPKINNEPIYHTSKGGEWIENAGKKFKTEKGDTVLYSYDEDGNKRDSALIRRANPNGRNKYHFLGKALPNFGAAKSSKKTGFKYLGLVEGYKDSLTLQYFSDMILNDNERIAWVSVNGKYFTSRELKRTHKKKNGNTKAKKFDKKEAEALINFIRKEEKANREINLSNYSRDYFRPEELQKFQSIYEDRNVYELSQCFEHSLNYEIKKFMRTHKITNIIALHDADALDNENQKRLEGFADSVKSYKRATDGHYTIHTAYYFTMNKVKEIGKDATDFLEYAITNNNLSVIENFTQELTQQAKRNEIITHLQCFTKIDLMTCGYAHIDDVFSYENKEEKEAFNNTIEYVNTLVESDDITHYDAFFNEGVKPDYTGNAKDEYIQLDNEQRYRKAEAFNMRFACDIMADNNLINKNQKGGLSREKITVLKESMQITRKEDLKKYIKRNTLTLLKILSTKGYNKPTAIDLLGFVLYQVYASTKTHQKVHYKAHMTPQETLNTIEEVINEPKNAFEKLNLSWKYYVLNPNKLLKPRKIGNIANITRSHAINENITPQLEQMRKESKSIEEIAKTFEVSERKIKYMTKEKSIKKASNADKIKEYKKKNPNATSTEIANATGILLRHVSTELNKGTKKVSNADRVREYKEKYPTAEPKDIIKATGISRSTVMRTLRSMRND